MAFYSHLRLLFILSLVHRFTCMTNDIKLTVEVESGSKECFFENIHVGSQFQVNFQVLDGGDFDISFSVHDPFDYRMASDDVQTSQMHTLIAPVSGDYKFCLDNSKSSFYSKIVYLDISVDSSKPEDMQKFNEIVIERSPLESQFIGMEQELEKIHTTLKKTRSLQGLFSAIESRSRSIAEQNFERVNFWSGVQLVVLFFSALLYIHLIRSLFAVECTRSKMKT